MNAETINTSTNDKNNEYVAQHPDAIQDVEKAQVMAEASDVYEERRIEDHKKAIEAAGRIATSRMWEVPGKAPEPVAAVERRIHRSNEAGQIEASWKAAKAAGEAYDQENKQQ